MLVLCYISGVVDSSGLRLWLTPTPQTYEASTIEIGELITPFMFVPPRQEQFKTFGYCPSSCIEDVGIYEKIKKVECITNIFYNISIFLMAPTKVSLPKKIMI